MNRKNRDEYLTSFVKIPIRKKDLDWLKKEVTKTTCRTLSEYARKVLLGKPIAIKCRDLSFDSFIEEAIALRNEMALVRQSLPWTRDGEARMMALQEQIKSIINKIFDQCKPK